MGFDLLPGDHPIAPVMLHDAGIASRFADGLLDQGVYAVAFSYQVVPKGLARLRTQMSAGFKKDDLEFAHDAFQRVKLQLGI